MQMRWETVLTVLGLVIVFLIIVIIADSHRFVVREYTFTDRRLRKNARVVLLSDLHNQEYGADNERLLKAIDLAAPDFIVAAGDMLTAVKGHDWAPAIGLLSKLAAHYPIYYGNGNHELRITLYPEQYGGMAEGYEQALAQIPQERLRNRHVNLPEWNVEIYGLDLARTYYRRLNKNRLGVRYLEKVLGKTQSDRVNVLIAHNPEYFKTYAAWGADVVVAGHVHGGIMRLPILGGVISPRLSWFPKYDGGEFKEGKAAMFLSRGLGTHTLPIRIFNPGELVVINLRRE